MASLIFFTSVKKSSTVFNGGNSKLFRRNFSTPGNGKMFEKILIANRGEIACRVMRTAKKMGIKTVAVHSDVDSNAKFVKMADEAVCIGPAPTSLSYLNMAKIVDAAKKTGAQAVHPGYGFLSENCTFAKMLEDASITWIGPPSSAIEALGNKIGSKTLARQAGVNIIPGKLAEAKDIEEVLSMAREIGYPVMIKAAHGGGGKGMRVVWSDEEAREGYRLAKAEAKASFGNDEILIEKFIDTPRHIEIQLMCDAYGNVVYLNERECSIQRRNQKVIEEAPSSFIDAKTRKMMGEQAASLAKLVGYRTAGTCEFLVDSKRNFYFLEMNTRLQVEHPITEYITGLDLVELMIRIAAGEPLPIKQSDVKLHGWAMESRVYAEDPYRNFLPSIGVLERYREPMVGDPNVRCDSGVREGDEISIYYDPLICKLVTYGANREAAIERMRHALDSYVIRGVNHNVCFLRSVLENPRFLKGDISTAFIPQEFPKGFQGFVVDPRAADELLGAACVMEFTKVMRENTISGQLKGYQPPTELYRTVRVEENDEPVKISRNATGNGYVIELLEENRSLEVFTDSHISSDVIEIQMDGKHATLQLMAEMGDGYKIQRFGTQYPVRVLSTREAELFPHMPVKKKIDESKALISPMPGRVHSIAVKVGDRVSRGQEILIVEAMKMQNILRAPDNVVVKAIKVNVGQDVALEELLVEFEPLKL